MRRYQPLGVLILIPALCLAFAAPGCGKKEEPKKGGDGAVKGDENKKKGDGAAKGDENKGGKKDKAGGGMAELESTGWGTVTGTVTYDGEPPTPKKINMSGNKDADACHADAKESELIDQTWIVNKENKGVANAVIYLMPPEGKFFKINESYLKKDKKDNWVKLHQPHCAFIPHVVVYWASYYDKDTGEQKPSGQKVRIMNDAKINHNTAWSGNEDINEKGSVTLAPGKEKDLTLNADIGAPIGVTCQFHTWMNAKIWSLNTPYAARTDKDGKFTIENVPTGAELYVVGWHDGVPGKYFTEGGKTGQKVKLEATNTRDFKIKAK